MELKMRRLGDKNWKKGILKIALVEYQFDNTMNEYCELNLENLNKQVTQWREVETIKKKLKYIYIYILNF